MNELRTIGATPDTAAFNNLRFRDTDITDFDSTTGTITIRDGVLHRRIAERHKRIVKKAKKERKVLYGLNETTHLK